MIQYRHDINVIGELNIILYIFQKNANTFQALKIMSHQ